VCVCYWGVVGVWVYGCVTICEHDKRACCVGAMEQEGQSMVEVI
jgi:hypothetical protein